MKPLSAIIHRWPVANSEPKKDPGVRSQTPKLDSDTVAFSDTQASSTALVEDTNQAPLSAKTAPTANPPKQKQPEATPSSAPTVLTLLGESKVERDQATILDDLTGNDRKMVGARLDKFPESTLRVLADQGITVGVYSYAKTMINGAKGTFETAFSRKNGEISSRTIKVARQTLPGGISAEFCRTPNLLWSGAMATAAVAVAAIAGPPGWALGAVLGGMAIGPVVESAVSKGVATLEHEATHALDSAAGLNGATKLPVSQDGKTETYYFSEKSKDVQECFTAARANNRFLTRTSKDSVKEYFAEAGGAYLTQDPNRSLNRQKLKEKDPAMFKVMEKFFEVQIPNLANRLSS
jgi:hypothetical protein